MINVRERGRDTQRQTDKQIVDKTDRQTHRRTDRQTAGEKRLFKFHT